MLKGTKATAIMMLIGLVWNLIIGRKDDRPEPPPNPRQRSASRPAATRRSDPLPDFGDDPADWPGGISEAKKHRH